MSEPVVIYKTRTDALLPRDASAIARKPLPDGRRPPLGLTILDDPDDDAPPPGRSNEATARAIVGESIERLGEAANNAATVRDIFELGIAMALELSFDAREFACELVRKLKAEMADGQGTQRSEIAELKLTITELRCELREMRAIQEQARALSRGEQGIIGPRGIPGPPGPAGQRGERGDAGPRPAGFVLDVAGYSATLVSSDGASSARLALRPLFEKFAEEIASDDEAA